MNRWKNKIAVCTGASAGIGAATTIDLVKSGMIVVGMARRKEKIEELKKQLPDNLKKNLHAVKCDVSKESEIIEAFKWIEKNLGGVSVLINNAGIVRTTTLIAANNSVPIREVLETNVFGLVNCSREAYQSMIKHSIDGHIININSILGHKVPCLIGTLPSLNIYPASKFAVTAITEGLRQDLMQSKSKIKVTSISPGVVATEIFTPELKESMADMAILNSEDISQAIIYALGTPPHVQIHEITIKPLGELM